jgi:DNA-binding response OmpR family regulator
MQYNILICDDDPDVLDVLEIYLTQEDYQVLRAVDGTMALTMIQAAEPGTIHLVLLDVMMPLMDGIETAVRIRETSNVPIIFLSAKTEEVDRVLGLAMGGDDYITKPMNPVELLARIKAALRRYARLGSLEEALMSKPDNDSTNQPDIEMTDQTESSMTNRIENESKQPDDSNKNRSDVESHPQPDSAGVEQPDDGRLYQTGDLILDDALKRVSLDDEEVYLTAMEYNILCFLMMHMEHVFTSSQIYEAVWGQPAFQAAKTVSVHIRHIREKIEINPREPRYLKVIYGLGYKVVKLQ